MKNTEKLIIGIIDDEWSETLEMLIVLDGNPYRYDDITDNVWSFKTSKMKKENEYVQFSCVCESIFKNCLPTLLTVQV
jgi:hypothetical protein